MAPEPRASALSLASLMATAADPFVAAAARAIEQRVGAPVHALDAVPWTERAARLARGEVLLGWTCGLWYTRARAAGAALEPLVAPIPAGARYGGRAVYFADVVVRASAASTSFADLRDARFAYNDPGSFSGLAVVRDHLAGLGERSGFFARAIETGSHAASLRAVAAGEADAAAIDSTVLDLLARAGDPHVAAVRAVVSLGPWPAPPVVAAIALEPARRAAVRDALLGLAPATLALGSLAGFAPATDADYDAIRRAADRADATPLTRDA